MGKHILSFLLSRSEIIIFLLDLWIMFVNFLLSHSLLVREICPKNIQYIFCYIDIIKLKINVYFWSIENQLVLRLINTVHECSCLWVWFTRLEIISLSYLRLLTLSIYCYLFLYLIAIILIKIVLQFWYLKIFHC